MRPATNLRVPPDLDNPDDQKQVMVVIVDTEASALREIDEVLRHLGGMAVCAVSPDVIHGKVPRPGHYQIIETVAGQ